MILNTLFQYTPGKHTTLPWSKQEFLDITPATDIKKVQITTASSECTYQYVTTNNTSAQAEIFNKEWKWDFPHGIWWLDFPSCWWGQNPWLFWVLDMSVLKKGYCQVIVVNVWQSKERGCMWWSSERYLLGYLLWGSGGVIYKLIWDTLPDTSKSREGWVFTIIETVFDDKCLEFLMIFSKGLVSVGQNCAPMKHQWDMESHRLPSIKYPSTNQDGHLPREYKLTAHQSVVSCREADICRALMWFFITRWILLHL